MNAAASAPTREFAVASRADGARRRALRFRIGVNALALALGLLFVAPFLFAFSTSLKEPAEIYVYPPQWLPGQLRWENYARAWTLVPFTRYVANTAVVTGLAMLGQVGSSCLVAYGFARFRFPGREPLFIMLLVTMIVPNEVTAIPAYLLFKSLNWIDTWLPLIVPAYFGGPFSVFLLRQFFLTLPRDLDEAAKIDGAGSFRILVQVLLPLIRPALATISIFSFIFHWNDFYHPLIYLNSKELFTLSLGLRYFQKAPADGGPVLDHYLMAASLVVTLPMIALFVALQRYFVQGIVMSGIKG